MRWLGRLRAEWVIGSVVVTAAPDDPDPGSGEDADGVGVIFASAGVVVDLGGPGAGVAAVVGEGGDGSPEALVTGPGNPL